MMIPAVIPQFREEWANNRIFEYIVKQNQEFAFVFYTTLPAYPNITRNKFGLSSIKYFRTMIAMKKFLLGLFIFLFIPFLFGLNQNRANASAFETNYDVYYLVANDGKIKVTQNITITNRLSDVYASKYSLSLKDIDISNVMAKDSTGQLNTEIVKTEQTTNIITLLKEHAVGVGQKQIFEISYEVTNLAKKKGQIWEVNIPKLAEENQIDSYTLTMEVPDDFGVISSVKPFPIETKRLAQSTLYKFSREQLLKSGITASFGQYQIFKFKLNYQISNPNATSELQNITLPPDTLYQKVNYQNISPQPINIKIDQDGNWLALYQVKPHENLNILVQGSVRIFADPQVNSYFISKNNFQNYLSPSKYWPTDNPEIKKLALELKTPRKIYEFVLNTLNYDYERVSVDAERLGALKALTNPTHALCMEFTDLFITIARAANIPSREINGFAYTSNPRTIETTKDILHSWPEYFDSAREIWVPIDPTWGDTTQGIDYFSKLDVYHFAFVIHGLDSVLPYPAGSYTNENSNDKNIEVVFGEYEKEPNPNIAIELILPDKLLFGKSYQGKIKVNNLGQTAVYNIDLLIKAEGVNISAAKENIPTLPPFGNTEIIFNVKPASFLSFGKAKIYVTVLDKSEVFTIQIGSLVWQIALPISIIALLIITVLFLTKKRFNDKKVKDEKIFKDISH
jgi:transglutaminase-like putative cysteine protease